MPEIGYLAQIDAAIGCKRTSCVEDIIDNQHRRGREQFSQHIEIQNHHVHEQ